MLPPTSSATHYEPALGCQECFAIERCGGYYGVGIDCLSQCCNEPSHCTYLCPRSDRFIDTWRDTDGILVNVGTLSQCTDELPLYVPLIQHGFRRITCLNIPFAAVSTFAATRASQEHHASHSPTGFRQHFRLGSTTRLILSSIGKDKRLEYFWKYRHDRRLIDRIASVNPAHIIAPNFSLFHSVPRLDNLANIKRSAKCAEEFSKAGLSVIPYLAGITTHDWLWWSGFLNEHGTISVVCKEFQTGTSSNKRALWHIQQFDDLQDRLGRPLHLIAIGGRRHLSRLRLVPRLTVIDSGPFMRTLHRRKLTENGWIDAPTPLDAPVDALLQENLVAYANRVTYLRHTPQHEALPRRTPVSSLGQYELWPQEEIA
jgi:hypothetical protein